MSFLPRFFQPFTNHERNSYIKRRYDLEQEEEEYLEDGAISYGQYISVWSETRALSDEVKYVLIGIPEDIGVRANLGRYGARGAWREFLKAFMSLQHSSKNNARRFCVLGRVMVEDLMEECRNLDANLHSDRLTLSRAVKSLDARVQEIALWAKSLDKTAIFIGGGHNNCFPLLKAYGGDQSIDCINIDAHTDLRIAHGRHSGNGFSHALSEGVLNKYAIMGINKNLLSDTMVKLLEGDERLHYRTLHTFDQQLDDDIRSVLSFIDTDHYVLEVDMDVVADFPSSAQSPLGYNMPQLEHIIRTVFNSEQKPQYVHICEAAPRFGYEGQVGKALAHLVNLLT